MIKSIDLKYRFKGYMNISQENQMQIDRSLEVVHKLLGKDLVNMSLFGSALGEGLKKYSDLDLLIITARNMTLTEKKFLIGELLEISGKYMQDRILRPIELTVLSLTDIKPWVYPPKFDFQYGEWLRGQFESGITEPWDTNENPDITILIKQAMSASINLLGTSLTGLLDPIPPQDFILACTDEVDKLIDDLEWDTRNVLLTLCRIWYSVDTLDIASKSASVDWVLARVPLKYQEPLIHAKNVYLGLVDENWKLYGNNTAHCANYLRTQITAEI